MRRQLNCFAAQCRSSFTYKPKWMTKRAPTAERGEEERGRGGGALGLPYKRLWMQICYAVRECRQMFRSDPFPFCPRLLLPSLYMQKSHADCEFSSSSARKCNASGGHLMAGLRGWSHWGGGWPAQPSCVQSTSSTANATFCFPAITFDHALNPPCSGQTLPPQPPSLLSHGFFIRTFLEKSVGQELEQGQRRMEGRWINSPRRLVLWSRATWCRITPSTGG